MKEIESLETFEKVINGAKPAVLKFEADWCPDCKRLNMFIGDIVEEHGDYDWYMIDRDKFPELAEKYEVMGIPSLLIFVNGEKIAHLHSANAKTPESVRDFLNTVSVK
ncbi:thioredoxin family protein [Camelliibacillus cellulosilyticus]|uniref:Thioredoxin family protein n=1 Tax=Camelliibacillus cellulosilyticus TaxID=2174486 RepID=A0ABV9GMH2_9BACL